MLDGERDVGEELRCQTTMAETLPTVPQPRLEDFVGKNDKVADQSLLSTKRLFDYGELPCRPLPVSRPRHLSSPLTSLLLSRAQARPWRTAPTHGDRSIHFTPKVLARSRSGRSFNCTMLLSWNTLRRWFVAC